LVLVFKESRSLREIDSMTMSAPWTRVNFGGCQTNQKGSGERIQTMIIIGCDDHPGFQQIAFVDTDTGEMQERRLQHREEAEKFYRELATQGMKVRVGMEVSGHARWFERQLSELQFELWTGDAAEIRTKRVRKQKTDRQDAQLILQWMLMDARRSVSADLGAAAGKIGICGNCYGTATGWYRRVRAS
jgi:hypothetical protein